MAVQYGTTYQQVIGAVADYYGAGSDQWYEIARHGIHSSQAESIISQVPYTNVIKNNAGQITGFTYDQAMAISDGGTAGAIDSNLQLPTQTNGNTFAGSIPASGSVDSQTGNINLSSGAKRVSDNTTMPSVLTTVTAGVAGLSFGLKTGKNILQRIYDGNPDYWDRTFPTINPQQWDTIAGSNELGKSVINAIFGINKNTGQTQMYLPEDAFAYYAYAMKQQGFFDTGGTDTASINDTTGLRQGIIDGMPYNCGSDYAFIGGVYNSGWTGNNPKPSHEFTGANPIYFFAITSQSGNYRLYACSKSSFRGTMYSENQYGKYTHSVDPNRATVNNKPVYTATINNADSATSITPTPIPYTYDSYFYTNEVAYVILYGTITSHGGKDGVETQDGATVPNTSTWSDIPSTDQSLRQQYPDAYTDAIYTDVPQPNGTTNRIVYIPVPTTPTTGSEDEQPTNNNEVQQSQEAVTDDSIESLLKTIVRYIMQTQTETPTETPTPPDTPNPTDTGDGNTPPVVVPTGSASALWSVYNPTQAQLNSFGAWLWSSSFIDQILKLFNNPMQSIIGVHKIFATPAISGSGNIVVGYLDSGVASNIVGAQYTTIDCGTVRVREQFGNVFDYNDTDVRLYLPFIGIVPLDVMDVMRGSVNVVYHVDVITGACLAEVKITRDGSGGTLYQFAGDAAVRYPISSGSYMGVVSGVLGVVGGIASGIMSGGATLPMAAGAIASGMSHAKTQVQHSGSFAGNAGAMGGKKPYLIIERPQTAIADGYGAYQGTGANNIVSVGAISGYFKMTDVHLDGIARATESELSEIENLLLSGVIT